MKRYCGVFTPPHARKKHKNKKEESNPESKSQKTGVLLSLSVAIAPKDSNNTRNKKYRLVNTRSHRPNCLPLIAGALGHCSQPKKGDKK